MLGDTLAGGFRTPFEATGHQLPPGLSAEQAMKQADQDWNVLERPIYTHDAKGHRTPPIPGYKATVRSDNESVLGIVRQSYKPTQNHQLYDFEAALTDDAGLEYETAGSFSGGKVVWALARLPKHLRINGDGSETIPYLLVWTGHDGSRGFGCGPTAIRVVCRNTFNMAVGGMVNKIVLRHTQTIDDRIGQARQALKVSFENLDSVEKVLNDLTRRDMTIDEFKAFTEELLPVRKDVKKEPTKTLRDRQALVDLFSDKSAPTLDGLKFTNYRALMAATEFVDHHRLYKETAGNSVEDNRGLSLLDGQGARMKQRALDLLVA